MSRSGYGDDIDPSKLALYRASVDRAIGGARGQAFLQRMIRALDALQRPELCEGGLVTPYGVCAMGAVVLAEGLDPSKADPDEREQVAALLDIAPCMAAEIAHENDEGAFYGETPEQRFERMRCWATDHVKVDGQTVREAERARQAESLARLRVIPMGSR